MWKYFFVIACFIANPAFAGRVMFQVTDQNKRTKLSEPVQIVRPVLSENGITITAQNARCLVQNNFFQANGVSGLELLKELSDPQSKIVVKCKVQFGSFDLAQTAFEIYAE